MLAATEAEPLSGLERVAEFVPAAFQCILQHLPDARDASSLVATCRRAWPYANEQPFWCARASGSGGTRRLAAEPRLSLTLFCTFARRRERLLRAYWPNSLAQLLDERPATDAMPVDQLRALFLNKGTAAQHPAHSAISTTRRRAADVRRSLLGPRMGSLEPPVYRARAAPLTVVSRYNEAYQCTVSRVAVQTSVGNAPASPVRHFLYVVFAVRGDMSLGHVQHPRHSRCILAVGDREAIVFPAQCVIADGIAETGYAGHLVYEVPADLWPGAATRTPLLASFCYGHFGYKTKPLVSLEFAQGAGSAADSVPLMRVPEPGGGAVAVYPMARWPGHQRPEGQAGSRHWHTVQRSDEHSIEEIEARRRALLVRLRWMEDP